MSFDSKYVKEMKANDLNDWIRTHGKSFGWVQAESMKSAQEAANSGHIVIILASSRTTSNGHVNVIIPESKQHHSETDGEGTKIPLQSQAGANNFKYGTNKSNPRWWEDKAHQDGAAWIFMGQPNSPIMSPEHLGLSIQISQSLLAPGQKGVGLPILTGKPEKGTSTNGEGKEVLHSALGGGSSIGSW